MNAHITLNLLQLPLEALHASNGEIKGGHLRNWRPNTRISYHSKRQAMGKHAQDKRHVKKGLAPFLSCFHDTPGLKRSRGPMGRRDTMGSSW